MTRYKTRLPPFAALAAFEAAARASSFTRAAEELGVSQPAVTRQIRDFEKMVGAPLFVRRHRCVELTDRGAQLAATLSASFSDIAEAVERLRVREEDEELTVTAFVAFTSLWLAPRITRFCSSFPHIAIHAISHHRTAGLLQEPADLAVRYGSGKWTDGEVHHLFNDELFPVCSPAYLLAAGGHIALRDLWRHRIIGDDDHGEWPSWSAFLRHHGVEGKQLVVSQRYTYYTDALFSALAGRGILMGWQALVASHIESGQLVRLSPEQMTSPHGHYLVVRHDKTDNAAVKALVAWLKEAS